MAFKLQMQIPLFKSTNVSNKSNIKIFNSFGILRHRFHCFDTSMSFKKSTTNSLIAAAIILHNMLSRWEGAIDFERIENNEDEPTAPQPDIFLWDHNGQRQDLSAFQH